MLITPQYNNIVFKPMITFRFDDGFEHDFTNAFPAMKSRGIRGSFYPITGRMNTAGYVTSEQIKEMARAGNEIGSHTHDHANMTTLSDEDILNELIVSKTLIEEATEKEVYSITPPNHGYDERIDRLCHGVYEFVSIRPEGHSASQSMQHYTRYGTQRNTTTQTISKRSAELLKSFVDEAIEKKVWLIMHTHKIVDVPPLEEGNYDLSLETFEELLDYVNTLRPHDLDVVTIKEGARRVQGIISPNISKIDAYYE